MSDSQKSVEQPIRIAVIGDVHGAWDEQDEVALKHLNIDLVLLVGDFGNESIDLVRSISTLDLPKAVVLGNHDAWYTATDWGMKQCPYDRTKEDRVQQQLDLLGKTHVGYGKLDFPDLKLSVVGSRPFSWGGSTWRNEDFYQQRYGVSSFEESTTKMVAAAKSTSYETLLFVGHCGPTGLGGRPEDPCGRDWKPLGGDFGDPDFAAAIEQVQAMGKTIPLVTFGHMHHQLRHTKEYLRKSVHVSDGTVYLNAANVPRIIHTNSGNCLRNFSLVTLQAGTVTQVSLLWLDQNLETASEQMLYTPGNEAFMPEWSVVSA